MSREHLSDVLDKFARITSIIVETSRIKESLDNCSSDEGLQQIHERLKVEVENLNEEAVIIKEVFSKPNKITVFNGNSADSEIISNGGNAPKSENVTNSSLEEDKDKDATYREKPLIKLVDIKKLVEPKSLSKPVYVPPVIEERRNDFDDTIVLITSSDDEEVSKQSKLTKNSKKRKEHRVVKPLKEARARPTSRRKAAEKTIAKTRLVLQDQEKSSDSSDESIPRGRKNNTRKATNLDNVALSDTSSGSDSSGKTKSTSKPKNKSEKRRNSVGSESEQDQNNFEWKKDDKLKSGCFVKVVRIPCEKLKEHYLEKLDLLKIKNLRNIDNLKRKKLQKSDSDSSTSGSEEHTTKKKKTSPKPTEDNKSSSSDEEVSAKNVEDPLLNELIELERAPSKDTPTDQEVELALNLMESDKGSDNESPEAGGTKSGDEVDKDDASKEPTPNTDDQNEAEKETQVVENSETNDKANSQSSDETNIDENKSDDEEKEEKSKDSKDGNKSDNKKGDKSSKRDEDKSEKEEEGDKSDSEEDKSEKDEEDKSDKDEQSKKKQKKDAKEQAAWKKEKLLTEKISSTDSEEEFNKFCKKKKNMQKEVDRLVKKRMKKILSDSDSDFEKPSERSSSDSEEEETKEKSTDEEEKSKPARKRVKRLHDSSDEDNEEKSTRKQIRNIWSRDSLAETTKKAEAAEKERKARIAEKQKKYNQVYENSTELNAKVDKVVLDFDEKNQEELLKVDDALVSKLKPHQASGIQFMWDACFESLERSAKTTGSGCILAHCMGLGKTLQVIALTHTLLINYEQTKVKKVMVVSPLNTVLNWVSEYKQWLPDQDDFDVFELVSFKQNYERQYQLKTWHNHGGVLIIGYDMFRNLSNPENKRLSKKMRAQFQEALVDPGPDLVVCDEGHLLKNEKTNISIAMNRLKTLRRIVLTGTPLQNNLKEYFCMVQFIKPSLLGTYKEYLNRFVNPITNGQYTDSTPHDIQVMRRRSHVLHKLLDGIVQRRDYSVLAPYLPPKHEYVLFLTLSETQIKLYQHYLDHFARRNLDGSNRTSFLFVDFQSLQRICTHPRVLLDKSIENKLAKEKRDDSEEDSEGSLREFINDDEEEESSSNSNSSSGEDAENKAAQKKRLTRAAHAAAKETGEQDDSVLEVPNEPTSTEKEWWQEYCDGDDLNDISHGSKLSLLFEILKECEQIEDKVLVFSQSLYSLNVIEYFLGRIHDATEEGKPETVNGFSGSWCLGLDYFRLDGSSSCDNRSAWCKTFNDRKNTRARLFLISTKAGGLGINLVAANRVIIFDVSWNPSHDIQSIYRVYRFGQTKPCYIYRFVTQGTMEMKIYERQVTKQAISKRVVDEQQIDRHYNQNDLQELYRFEPKPDRPTPLVPKDVLLGELLQKFADRIYKYHEHQSLLENKEEEGLNEEERKAAWEEFENEKKHRINFGNAYSNSLMNVNIALSNILRKENPAWTENQIKSLIPTFHAQLQDQVAQGDLTLYKRVQQEMQMLQAIRNQQMKENFYREQAMKLMQQQQQVAAAMNLVNGQNASWVNHYLNQMPGPSQVSPATNLTPNEVIDLND